MIKFYQIVIFLILFSCASHKPKEIGQIPEAVGPRIQKLNPDKMYGFRDMTEELGLGGVEATHIYVVDLNNDGRQDLVFLPDFYSTPLFYLYSQKEGKFVKSLHDHFELSLKASFLNFFDFNNDSIVDVLVGPPAQKTELTQYPLRLFKGEVNEGVVVFKEVLGAFSEGINSVTSAVVLDYDLDGILDVFQSNWFSIKQNKSLPTVDNLFKGSGEKFLNVSYLLKGEYEFDSQTGAYPNATASFGASVCDVDLNGFPDILVSSSGGYQNKLWLNLFDQKHNDRVYMDYGKESGFAHDDNGSFEAFGGGNSVFSICNDYNNDGIMDVALGEINFAVDSDKRDRSSILTGKNVTFPPKFFRTEYSSIQNENWNQGDRRGNWIDLNFDGLDELVIDNSGFPPQSKLLLFEHMKDHSFQDLAIEYGLDIVNPSGTVYLDVNKDGRMDLLVGQSGVRLEGVKRRVFLLLNTRPRQGRRTLSITLEGQKSNKDAIGARVILYTNKTGVFKQALGASGNQPSQSSKEIHFGLGKEKVLSAVVLWPFSDNKIPMDSKPHRVIYDLSKLKFRHHLSLKLCENGKILTQSFQVCE